MENIRKETLARITAVRWRWMVDELVDEEARHYEIFLIGRQHFARSPHGSVMPLGLFFTSDPLGRRLHQLYLHFNRRRIEDLDGATIDIYPRGAERLGLGIVEVEGSALHGMELR